ncbi:MAG: ABC transporter ATP-binding protein, partial [Verrucomicrobiota bacterium]
MSRPSRPDRPGPELPRARLDRESLAEALGLFRYLRPYRVRFVAALAALLFASLGSLAFPYLAGRLIDAASAPGARAPGSLGVNETALLLLAVLAAQAGFAFFHSLSFATVGQRSLVDIRRDTYARLVGLPMGFFAGRRVGELASRLSADLAQIEDVLISFLPQFLRQSTLLVGGVFLLATTSLQLTGLMLTSLPAVTGVAVVFGRKTRRLAREAQDRLAETATVVEETLQGMVNVKAFTNETFELGRYADGLRQFLGMTLHAARLRAAFIAFVVFSLFGSMVLVLWSGARLLARGEITFGELTRFLLYTTFVAGAMGQFAELYSQIQKAVGSTQRVRELLRETPEIPVPAPAPEPGHPARIRGEVELDGVRFRYPSRPDVEVLRGVSLRAAPGERVALVGPSGAGKSTLISLLLRLYDPTAGTVRVDGRDARELPLTELRGQMSIVPQEVLLFGGTIAANIGYGKP